MRKSRKAELLWFLSLCSEGMTIKEIVGEHETSTKTIFQPLIKERVIWPRATVFRLLKKLITDKKVIKQRDSRTEGCRGRPALRYQANPSRKFILKYPLLGITYYKSYSRMGEKRGLNPEKDQKNVYRRSPEQKQFLKEYSQYFKK
jgi:hypothetical protein